MPWLVNEKGQLVESVSNLTDVPITERLKLAELGLLPPMEWRVEWRFALTDKYEKIWANAFRGTHGERFIKILGFVMEDTIYLEMYLNSGGKLMFLRSRPSVPYFTMTYLPAPNSNLQDWQIPQDDYFETIAQTGMVVETIVKLFNKLAERPL